MRGGSSDGVEDLTARSPTAHEVIPDGFSELTAPSCQHQAATGLCDTAAGMCCGLESCAPLPRPLRTMVGRPTFLRSPAGEAGRYIRLHFCVSRGDTGGVTPVSGCA